MISNGFAAYQEPVLEALGLLGYFDAVITPERAGAAKPEPQIFAAAGRLDLFVGDTLVHDILGANQAGVPSAWLPPRPIDLCPLIPQPDGRIGRQKGRSRILRPGATRAMAIA